MRESTTELYLRVCGKQPEPPEEADVKVGQFVRPRNENSIWRIVEFVSKWDSRSDTISRRKFIRLFPMCGRGGETKDAAKTFFRRRWKPIKVKTFGDPDHGVEPEFEDMVWRTV